MSLKIVVIADARIPVPPQNYGGAERIIDFLCAGLRDLGHEIRLVAAPGSRDYGGGLFTHCAPTQGHLSRAGRKLWFQAVSLRAARGADVVLNHGRLDYLEAILRTRVPLLHHFHNPVPQAEVDWVLKRREKNVRFIGVSHSQMAGVRPIERIDVIHTVADTEKLVPLLDQRPAPYLAFFGRMTAAKGADTAIAVAQRAGLPLKMAGPVPEREIGGKEFFAEKIQPHLGRGVEYLGMIDDVQKHEMLAHATGLLFPIRWKEPCAAVPLESMACGTPVIATRCASTPEVIDEGQTGFLADNEDGLVEAVSRLEQIDRSECRRIAVKRFSPQRLVEDYLNCIEKVSA